MLRALLLLALAATLVSDVAHANGRFPRAERLLTDPADSKHWILGATYGLLVTTDAGETWRHVCEASFADADLQTDPVIALTADGGLLAGIYASIARADSGACDFQKTLGLSNREAVPDFTLVAQAPGRVMGVLVSLVIGGPSQNQLYASDDGGRSWSALGAELPPSMRTVLTVDVAPSDAKRVYLSGLDADGAGVLLRSNDGGESFEALAIPTDASHDEAPYIAAVDAENADALYVRTDQWIYDAESGNAVASDALLYSDDGGEHFVELARQPGKLYGFAFSPEGDELMIGYGDPVESGGGRLTDPGVLGIYRAAAGSADFQKTFDGSVGCLTWSGEGLFVCTLEAEAGFSLGFTARADFDLSAPAELEPKLKLADVAGPLECPACSTGAICASYWQAACQSWGRDDCESLIPAEPPECGGAGGEASSSGGDAATGGASVGSPPVEESYGCSCRTPRGSGSEASALLLCGLLWISARARRAAAALRSGGSPSCRKRTARALAVPRRHDRA